MSVWVGFIAGLLIGLSFSAVVWLLDDLYEARRDERARAKADARRASPAEPFWWPSDLAERVPHCRCDAEFIVADGAAVFTADGYVHSTAGCTKQGGLVL